MDTINLNFIHDGKSWVVKDGNLSVKAKNLSMLDKNLKEEIRHKYLPAPGERIAVNLEFDYSSIPLWMIQYHPYYITRRLEFNY